MRTIVYVCDLLKLDEIYFDVGSLKTLWLEKIKITKMSTSILKLIYGRG